MEPAMDQRLMAVFAHPDDESMGVGSTLAKYAAEGVEITLVTATRGERGWFGPSDEDPGMQALGVIREKELHAAAEALGICRLEILDYIDGELCNASIQNTSQQIARLIREVQPQVVITFDPYGVYGHPDHIAISQLAAAALVYAASPTNTGLDSPPHQVVKFYYFVVNPLEGEIFRKYFGGIGMEVNGEVREMITWPDWAVTTRLDLTGYWQPAKEAILCHKTQLPSLENLDQLTEEDWRRLNLAQDSFYRVFSLVDIPPGVETDLFTGIR